MRIHRAIRVGLFVGLITLVVLLGVSSFAAWIHGGYAGAFVRVSLAASLLFGVFAAALSASVMSVQAASTAGAAAFSTARRRATVTMTAVSFGCFLALWATRPSTNPGILAFLFAAVTSAASYAIHVAGRRGDEG